MVGPRCVGFNAVGTSGLITWLRAALQTAALQTAQLAGLRMLARHDQSALNNDVGATPTDERGARAVACAFRQGARSAQLSRNFSQRPETALVRSFKHVHDTSFAVLGM